MSTLSLPVSLPATRCAPAGGYRQEHHDPATAGGSGEGSRVGAASWTALPDLREDAVAPGIGRRRTPTPMTRPSLVQDWLPNETASRVTRRRDDYHEPEIGRGERMPAATGAASAIGEFSSTCAETMAWWSDATVGFYGPGRAPPNTHRPAGARLSAGPLFRLGRQPVLRQLAAPDLPTGRVEGPIERRSIGPEADTHGGVDEYAEALGGQR